MVVPTAGIEPAIAPLRVERLTPWPSRLNTELFRGNDL